MGPENVALAEWRMIERVLPSDYEELARQTGVIREQPPQLKTKIKDARTLLRLLLLHVGLRFSLKLTASVARSAGLIDLSSVAIHKRMRTSGPFLAALLARLLQLPSASSRRSFRSFRVRAVDGTTITRPGSHGTDARIHYKLGLPGLDLVDLKITDEHVGETLLHFPCRPGELLVADRLYSNPKEVHYVSSHGAFILVRLNRRLLPLFDRAGERIDLLAKLDEVDRRKRQLGWVAWVHATDEQGQLVKIPGRLCIRRLSTKKAAEARKRLRKEQGAEVSEKALRFAGYLLLFTTAPKERLSLREVFELYRLRWQVELRIKRDKSIGNVDELPNRLPETIYSWLLLEMLVQVLAEKLAAPEGAFSPSGERSAAAVGADQADDRGSAGGAATAGPAGAAAAPA